MSALGFTSCSHRAYYDIDCSTRDSDNIDYYHQRATSTKATDNASSTNVLGDVICRSTSVEILVDATLAMIKNSKKRKRGMKMKKISEGLSSLGLEIPVTMAISCVHVSPLTPLLMSRLTSMSSFDMVPSTLIPDFASRSIPIVQSTHQQLYQAKSSRHKYASDRSRDSLLDLL
ncbi:hypothetical protein Scep_026059 [Stephania cephalantha]|uniref:Uncharacterized protein n=1 Tax=Stephania cephalantha TaxID=152367 RepID=A0AAP0HT02_9MAGN